MTCVTIERINTRSPLNKGSGLFLYPAGSGTTLSVVLWPGE